MSAGTSKGLFTHARRSLATVLVLVGLSLPVVGAFARADEPPAPAAVGVKERATYRPHETTLVDRARSAGGIVVLLVLCVALSKNRRRIDWRLVGIGLALQAALAVLLLGTGAGRGAFDAVNRGIDSLLAYSNAGAAFIFTSHVTGKWAPELANFAFKVLPTIVFFSSLMAVLYHVGLMGAVVRGLAWAMQRTMRTSGAETLSTAANIFVGQTEAPLLIRPFVATLTQSEMLVIMAGGMANTAGGVLGAYVQMLGSYFPDIGGHLLFQSILSAPAALVTSKIIWPEDGTPTTNGQTRVEIPRVDSNVVEAASRGATEGLALAFNVAAMLIAFIALITMLDDVLKGVTGLFGAGFTFEQLAGWVFTPFAWIMGVPGPDCQFVGELLGQKTVVNEFVAYAHLGATLESGAVVLSQRAVLIASYALSGFANFGSIGILIGGIGAMAPERRGNIAALGLYALVAGTFATFMTACFAGILG